MTRADALRPHLKFRRWRGRFGVMTENQNHIKATACRIWKFAEKIACRFSNRIAIVWTVSVLVWLAAIAASFIFDKWWTVRNFALFSTPLLGFPLLFQRTRAQDKQADAAMKQAEFALMQAKTDSRRRLTEAFARAAEQFPHPELSVRLGGLYALWSLAQEAPKLYHVQVMRILCAFVRRPLILNGWANEKLPGRRPDIDAVLTLICRRSANQIWQENADDYRLNFNEAYLRVAQLSRTHFQNADFIVADLRDAFFINSNLQDARFWRADLRGAQFDGADLNDHIPFRYRMLFQAAINGAELLGAINLPPIENMGVVLTDETGKILHPGLPLLPERFNANEVPRMTLQEWEEKRAGTKGKA